MTYQTTFSGTYRINPQRNPWGLGDFVLFLQGKGMDRFASLVEKYPDVVEPFLDKIHARLIEKGLLSAPAAAAPSGELTDREGWTQLAGLVDEALGDQPQALREALKQAFLAEAAKS